jgi:CO/xanthine dehydrogenase FAD-binding subunit
MVSSQRKRQRSDKENAVNKENTDTKQGTIAAVRVALGIAAEKPIREMNPDAKEEF